MTEYFSAGQIVQLRGYDQIGETCLLVPVRVVEDSPRRTVLYTAEATPIRGRPNLMERILNPDTPVDMSPRKWQDTDFISITYPGDMYSIWAMWKIPELRFQCRYVNIEIPQKRTAVGFETRDLELDVVIRPDLTWYWKDEADYERLTELGYFSPELSNDIRQAGLGAITRLESREEQFNEPWPDWIPDPSWMVPEFPEEWMR